MQLLFEKQPISCLQTVKREVQSQEQTQELRISDGMPDIGNIIGAWGQVILRSKEWLPEGMTVSGGTMVWVQYQPEGGGEIQCVESWLPFQLRWPFPQTQHDGVILAQCQLCSVDARSTSARKMILRSNISVLGWAMVARTADLCVPAEIPQDVQLKTEVYPVELPVEAGEKAFSLEETLNLPPSAPTMEKLMYYTLQTEITEEKLMGDKVVFRGNGVLHILYRADDGGLYTWDFDVPFTQYGELEKEYSDRSRLLFVLEVTSLEVLPEAGKLHLRAGLVCQYRVCDICRLEVVTDAYSPGRKVELIQELLDLPVILETRTETIHPAATQAVDGMRLTDVTFFPGCVQARSYGETVTLEIPGQFQIGWYDHNGAFRSNTQKWENTLTLPAGDGCTLEATAVILPKAVGNLTAGTAQLSADLKLILQTVSGQGIPMISAMEVADVERKDPHRPNLVIMRPEGKSLWQLAKENASTVDAIREANGLQTEPEEGQMLLIPTV